MIIRGALIALTALFFSACVTPPGKGTQAENGYKACEPIILALEKYYAKNLTYPARLIDLIPNYIPVLPAKINNFPVTYKIQPDIKKEYQKDDPYVLSFRYTGPGMNICDYFATNKEWKCHGFF